MIDVNLKDVAEELEAQVVQLEASPRAQQLLESFFSASHAAAESVRIQLAKQLYQDWQDANVPTYLFPAVPEKDDWWYLIQLFALDRHRDSTGKPWHFDLSKSREIVVLSQFAPTDSHPFSPIWQALWQKYGKRGAAESQYDQKIATRAKIDELLYLYADQVLATYHLDPMQYELRHINLAELLRAGDRLKIGLDESYVHIDGYRVRLDGQIDGLIAGNAFGGARFIDSWWSDMFHSKITTYLVICKKYEL
jgi:hypothetical protein